MFSPADIRNRLTEQPFKPFRIVTASGESYEVMHPDLLLVGTNDVVVGFPGEDDPAIYSNVSRVALMHVTAMEDIPESASKSKGNGAT